MHSSEHAGPSLNPSKERNRRLRTSVSPYRAMRALDRAMRLGAPPPPAPEEFGDALYARLQAVERRETWQQFLRVLVRCASVLVIEGD